MELEDIEIFAREGNMETPVMTIEEVAAYLRVHRTSLYRWIKTGAIPYFKAGSDYRFLRSEIDRYARGEWKSDQS